MQFPSDHETSLMSFLISPENITMMVISSSGALQILRNQLNTENSIKLNSIN